MLSYVVIPHNRTGEYMDRDLGELGECTFAKWCASTGIVANSSRIDKNGWDFYLEFPLKTNDFHNAFQDCKVQVKSTDHQKRKLSLTLSNLHKLATSLKPCFIVFIEFDREEDPQKVFLVHVDNDLVEKVLKRIHKIKLSGEELKLNTRTMQIKYDEKHLLPDTKGKSVKDVLLSYFQPTYEKYVQLKEEFIRTVGYEEGQLGITFSTDIDLMNNLSLGLEDSVKSVCETAYNIRFGMKEDNQELSGQPIEIKMPNIKPQYEGEVTFKETKIDTGLSFKARLYVPAYKAPTIKIRIQSSFFDMVIFEEKLEFSFSFKDVTLSIDEMCNALSLLKSIKSCCHISCSFGDYNFSYRFLGNEASVNTKSFNQTFETAEQIRRVIQAFKIPSLEISLEELYKYENQINNYAKLIGLLPFNDVNVTYKELSVNEGDPYTIKKSASIIIMETKIQHYTIGAILVAFGDLKKNSDGQYLVEVEDIIIEKKYFFSGKKPAFSFKDIKETLEVIEKKYDDSYYTITIVDKDLKNNFSFN